jgi:NH3-dependent NAD+ synthetase
MAEVAALVLAISGGIDITIRASSQVTQLLRLWNDAPEQIASLSVDIHHMHWVVVQLEQLCEDPAIRADASIVRAISGHLFQAYPLSVKLEEILRTLNKKDERSRNLYWMRNTTKVSSLVKEIEQLRLACVQTLAFCMK